MAQGLHLPLQWGYWYMQQISGECLVFTGPFVLWSYSFLAKKYFKIFFNEIFNFNVEKILCQVFVMHSTDRNLLRQDLVWSNARDWKSTGTRPLDLRL